MSIFQRSETCSFFQELYSHIDKNSGETFKDMFLVKIVSKGTSLRSTISGHIIEFLQRDDNSRMMPGKKDFRNVGGKESPGKEKKQKKI